MISLLLKLIPDKYLMPLVMHRLGAVPLTAMIQVDENRQILVRGRPVSTEQLVMLKESAAVAVNSQARNLIKEQVRFMAIDQGFLKSDDPKTQTFYKAALWFAQEEDTLLRQMAGPQDQSL